MANKRTVSGDIDEPTSKRRDDKLFLPDNKTCAALLDLLRSTVETTLAAIRLEADKENLKRCKHDVERSTRLDPQFKESEKAKCEAIQTQLNESSQKFKESGFEDDRLAKALCAALAEDFKSNYLKPELDLMRQQWSQQQENEKKDMQQRISSLEQRVNAQALEYQEKASKSVTNRDTVTEELVVNLINCTVSEATRHEAKEDLRALMAQEVPELEHLFKKWLEEAKQQMEDQIKTDVQQLVGQASTASIPHEDALKSLREAKELYQSRLERIKSFEETNTRLEDRVEALQEIVRHVQEQCDDLGELARSSITSLHSPDAYMERRNEKKWFTNTNCL